MPPGVATWRAILQSFGGDMALTIRNIDEKTQKEIDKFKKRYSISTNSKALLYAVHAANQLFEELNTVQKAHHEEGIRADNAERILETLRDTMKSALTILDQRELKL